MYLDKSGLEALWNKIKTMFDNIKTDLTSTQSDLASTKGGLSGVNAHLDSIEARLNNLYNIVSNNFTTAKNDDASIRNELSKRIHDTESELRTSIGNTETRLRKIIDAKKIFDLTDLTVDHQSTTITANINATEAELESEEMALARVYFDNRMGLSTLDLECSDGATRRYTLYAHDSGNAIVVLTKHAVEVGNTSEYLAFALQSRYDMFLYDYEYDDAMNGKNPIV